MALRNKESQAISFHVNGKEYVVNQDLTASTTLNDYLRNVAELVGTKVMCNEAGCGCCAVTVSHGHPRTGKMQTYSVQSCLLPLNVVDGWQISTAEGIGNQKNGFHPIQERVASFNGSQCGYCTPGIVMNMYGLLHQNPKMTAQEIEDSFDGNICRCTGYRPILDAMKSFASDNSICTSKPADIEDLNIHLCPKTGEVCQRDTGGNRPLELDAGNVKWFRPVSLANVAEIYETHPNAKIQLLFGNTAKGIYKNEEPIDIFVDLHAVKETFVFETNESSMTVGGGTTLTELISHLKANADKPGFGYFAAFVKHIKMIGNVMVRNAGCIAGNLMIKHKHPEFPSDLFTLFLAAAVTVEVYDCFTRQRLAVSALDFLKNLKMEGKIITSVTLPRGSDNEVFKSFKVSPRWQNAHAYVNAAFRLAVNDHTIVDRPSIVFGGIGGVTAHAVGTETFLTGKTIDKNVVKEALATLKEELTPDLSPLLASPEYRKDLACSLLYKALLGICGSLDSRLVSGRVPLHRPISSGLQTYQEKKSDFPLKNAMPKKTAPLQASGEAIFVNDMPQHKNELFAAFVLSEEGNATIDSLDPSEALTMPGVVRFLSAKDIPEGGVNNYMPRDAYGYEPQELFATKEIEFSGQAVGVILAESRNQAFDAVSKVRINYSEIRKPILTLDESIQAGKEFEYPEGNIIIGQPEEAMKSADEVIEGETRMGSQTHFFVENHISLAVPSEDGIDMFVATQYADMMQCVAATVIGKPMNYINVTVPRLGGGFGGKSFDSGPAAGAASLAAYVTGRPVRVATSLSNVMRMSGKRPPALNRYKVAVNRDGKIQAIEMDFYMDCGHNSTAIGELFGIWLYMDLGYYIPHWKVRLHPMMTNKQRMSAVRAPGAAPAALMGESMMEHAARVVNMHPIVFKEINLIRKHQVDTLGYDMKDCNLEECWHRLKAIAEVERRMGLVDAFNRENLWKKRGITMTVLKYGIVKYGATQGAHVSVYARDGTVFVTQSGVEMGQGLYTKVSQGVAHALGVPMDHIKVRPNQNGIIPNPCPTGGSTVSETSTQAAIQACQILKERMQPIREKFPDLDWKELCAKCASSQIDLSAKFLQFPPEDGNKLITYFVHAAAVFETEVDILTGESQILRVDFMGDFGESLNPSIDIGQIEGALVIGLGCYLSEDVVFDERTGAILNDGTWEYKPPTSKDIPIDWRIHLMPDRSNPLGFLGAKALGEPPLCMSVGALLANKAAVLSARKDLFGVDDFLDTVAPYTVEKVQQSVGLDIEHLAV